jgi:uncharacterized protein with HEPN domain
MLKFRILFLLVEGELRKGFESLDRLGRSFFRSNPSFRRDRIGEIRQQLTHDYVEIDREFVWNVAHDEAPVLIRQLTRAKVSV